MEDVLKEKYENLKNQYFRFFSELVKNKDYKKALDEYEKLIDLLNSPDFNDILNMYEEERYSSPIIWDFISKQGYKVMKELIVNLYYHKILEHERPELFHNILSYLVIHREAELFLKFFDKVETLGGDIEWDSDHTKLVIELLDKSAKPVYNNLQRFIKINLKHQYPTEFLKKLSEIKSEIKSETVRKLLDFEYSDSDTASNEDYPETVRQFIDLVFSNQQDRTKEKIVEKITSIEQYQRRNDKWLEIKNTAIEQFGNLIEKEKYEESILLYYKTYDDYVNHDDYFEEIYHELMGILYYTIKNEEQKIKFWKSYVELLQNEKLCSNDCYNVPSNFREEGIKLLSKTNEYIYTLKLINFFVLELDISGEGSEIPLQDVFAIEDFIKMFSKFISAIPLGKEKSKQFDDSIRELIDSLGVENLMVQKKIKDFEKRMREFLKVHLINEYGEENWLEKGIPNEQPHHLYDTLISNMKTAQGREPYKKDDIKDNPLIGCTIKNYYSIIKHNWNIFEKIFISSDEVKENISIINNYRNLPTHSNDASKPIRKKAEGSLEWFKEILGF